MKHASRLALLLLCLGSLCLLPACDDDPTSPRFTFDPVLAELWPHADGTAWSFGLEENVCPHPDPGVYENLADIPPIPSVLELYGDLRDAPPCWQEEPLTGTLQLMFDGVAEVAPDLEAQRLRSLVMPGTGYPDVPLPLGEMLWRLEDDRIAGYSEYVGPDPTWIYLTEDLQPGDEFSQQLLTGLSDDISLYGRVWRHVKRTWNGELHPCVELFYLLDMGVAQMTDEGGQVTGYVHPYFYGVVLYAQGVGPISCRERRFVFGDGVLQDSPGSVVIDILATLLEPR